MMNLLQYIIAIIIVILVLTGFVILAVVLRPSEETAQQPKEKEQTLDEALGVDEPSSFGQPARRSLLNVFRKNERTLG